MMPPDQWLNVVAQRLTADGFTLTQGAALGLPAVAGVALRERFEMSRFGVHSVVIYLMQLSPPTSDALRAFSQHAAMHADSVRRTSMPNGFFAATSVYAVAYSAQGFAQDVPAFLEAYEPTHMAKMEFPVAVDLAYGQLAYKRKTPLWGAAYFSGMRDFAERTFSPRF